MLVEFEYHRLHLNGWGCDAWVGGEALLTKWHTERGKASVTTSDDCERLRAEVLFGAPVNAYLRSAYVVAVYAFADLNSFALFRLVWLPVLIRIRL